MVFIVERGTLVTGNYESMLITVIKQDWDHFHEEIYGSDQELNNDGFAFYAIYGGYENLLYANRSRTCFSKIETMQLVEETFKVDVLWEYMETELRLQ